MHKVLINNVTRQLKMTWAHLIKNNVLVLQGVGAVPGVMGVVGKRPSPEPDRTAMAPVAEKKKKAQKKKKKRDPNEPQK